MNPKYLDVLACPTCRGPLGFDAAASMLTCAFERLAYPIQDGVMLLERSHAVDLNPIVQPTAAQGDTQRGN